MMGKDIMSENLQDGDADLIGSQNQENALFIGFIFIIIYLKMLSLDFFFR